MWSSLSLLQVALVPKLCHYIATMLHLLSLHRPYLKLFQIPSILRTFHQAPPVWKPRKSIQYEQYERYLCNQTVPNNGKEKFCVETNIEASQISGALTSTISRGSTSMSQTALRTTWTGPWGLRCSRSQGRWSQKILIKGWDREDVL